MSTEAPLYFDCHMCGECCSSWNIPIESEKAERLLEKEWAQKRLAETRRELTPMGEGMHRIPLTDENVCVFLGENRLCMVEQHEGLALKPHECQRFPFATVRMADGTARHDTSAACKVISEKLLLAFQPILPKPTPLSDVGGSEAENVAPQTRDWLEDVGTFPAEVRLTLFRKLAWADYETRLTALKPVFESTEMDVDRALSIARGILLKGNVPDNKRLADESGMKRCNAAKRRRDRSQPDGWRRQLVVLFFLRKPYRTWSTLQLAMGRSYHDPRLFGLSLDLNAHRQVRWNNEQACERRLKAFLLNILCRKRLIASGGSVESLLAMTTVAAGLVRWYARALAVLEGEVLMDDAHVATAIRLVERYYTGHQPRFFQWFLSHWPGALLCLFIA